VVTTVVVAYPDADAAIMRNFMTSTFPWARCVSTNTLTVFHEAMMRPLDATNPLDADVIKWRMNRYKTADADDIVHAVKMAHPGYAAQIYDKIQSDKHVAPDTAFIVHIDSDTVLHRRLRWSDVFANDGDRPRLERESWARVGEQAERNWRESTAAALKLRIDDDVLGHDYMRRLGNTYPVGLYGLLRRHIETLHGVDDAMTWFVDRAASRLGLPASEFEVLGAFAFKYHHNLFEWSTCGESPHTTWESCLGYVRVWDAVSLFVRFLLPHDVMAPPM
jgi:hypothetical protein